VKSIRRTAAGAVGVLATLLLHSLFFAVAIWGSGEKRIARLPEAVGAGANSGSADGSSTDRMIIIRLSSDVQGERAQPDEIAQLEATIKASMLEVTGPDILPPPPLVFEDEGEPEEASDADLIARTRLTGLYENQIRARIERSWTQPRETTTAPLYSCRVKITQERDGRVVDVILQKCEGSTAWLDSLVKAIYSASPLPGPPHAGVFMDSFSMQFRSVPSK
jgi:membrane protein involved in colicin uptake